MNSDLWPSWYSPYRKPSVHHVINLASTISGLTVREIMSGARYQTVALVRHAISTVAIELGNGVAHTGRILGKDHTTICTNVKRAYALMERDAVYREFVHELKLQAITIKPLKQKYGRDFLAEHACQTELLDSRSYPDDPGARRLRQVSSPKPSKMLRPIQAAQVNDNSADDLEEFDEIEMLSRAVAAHYAEARA